MSGTEAPPPEGPPEARPPPARPPARRLWARRFWRALGAAVLAAAILGGGAFGWLRTPAGNAWMLAQLLPRIQPPDGSIEVDALRTDLLSEVGLSGVRVRDAAGRALLEVPTVAARLRLGSLPALLVIEDVQARGIRADLRIGEAGLDLASLWADGPPPDPADGSGEEPFTFPLEVRLLSSGVWADSLAISGGEEGCAAQAPECAPWRVEVRDVELGGGLRGWRRSVELSSLRLRVGDAGAAWPGAGDLQAGAPGLLPLGGAELAFTGSVLDWRALRILRLRAEAAGQSAEVVGTVGDLSGAVVLDLAIPAIRLDPAGLQGLGGALRPWVVAVSGLDPLAPLPISGAVTATGRVRGDLRHPEAELLIGTAGGAVAARGGADLAAGTWEAHASSTSLHLGRLGPALPRVEAGGAVEASGDLSGGRVRAALSGAWVEGIAGLGRAEVEGAAALEGGRLRLEGATLQAASGLEVGVAGEIGVSGPGAGEGTAEIRRLRVPLARIREVPGMLGAVPGLAEALGPQVAPLAGLDLGGWLEWSGRVEAAGGGYFAAGDLLLEGFRWRDQAAAQSVGGPVELRYGPGVAGGRGSAAGPGWLDDLLLTTALEAEGLMVVAGERAWRADRGSVEAELTPAGGGWALGLLSYAGSETREILGTSGRWERASGRIAVDRLDGRLPGVPPFSVRATGALKGRREEEFRIEEIDALALLGLEAGEGGEARGRLEVRGGAGLAGPLDLDVVGTGLRPAQIRELAGLDGWAGVLDVELHARGTVERPRVEGQATARGLTVPGAVRGLDARVDLEGDRERWRLVAEAQGGGIRATVEAPLRLEALLAGEPPIDPAGRFSLEAALAPARASDLAKMLDGVDAGDLGRAEISASVSLGGPVADPQGRAAITAVTGVGPEGDRVQVDLDLALSGGQIEVDGTIWERLLPRGVLRGGVPFDSRGIMARLLRGEVPDAGALVAAVGALDVDVVARKVPLRVLDPWLPAPGRLSGVLAGSLKISGALRDPKVRGLWLLDGAKVGRTPVPRGLITLEDLTLEDGSGALHLTVDAGFGDAPGQPSTGQPSTGLLVEAAIPLSIDLLDLPSADALMEHPGLDLRLSGPGVPLQIAEAALPGLEVERGVVRINGAVTGSLADPRPDLSLSLADAALSLDATGVRYDHLDLDAALVDHTFALTRLSVESASRAELLTPDPLSTASRLTGQVEIPLAADWTPLGAAGEFDLDGFRLLALPDRQIRVSGRTKLSGSDGRVNLRGGVRVDRALVRLREDFFVSDTSATLHPDIHIVGVTPDEESAASGLEGLVAQVPSWLKVVLDIDLTETLYGAVSMPLEDRFGAVGRDFSTVRVEGAIGGNLRAELDHQRLLVIGDLAPERGQVRVLGKTFQVQEGRIAFTGRDVLTPVLDLTATYPTRDYGPMTLKIGGTPDQPRVAFSSDAYAEEDVMAILLTGSPASSGEGPGLGQLLTSAVLGIAQDSLGGGGGGVVESVQLDTLGVQGGFRISRNVSLYTRYNFANNLTSDPAFVEITLEWSLPDDWSMEIESGKGASISAWHTWWL